MLYFVFDKKKEDHQIDSPSLENFEISIGYTKDTVFGEERDAMNLNAKYYFDINSDDDSIYSIEVILPERLINDVGRHKINENLRDGNAYPVEQGLITFILSNNHAAFLDSYEFDVNLFRNDKVIQTLHVNSILE